MSFLDCKTILSVFFITSQLLSWIIQTAGEFCEAYVDDAGTYHTSKHCPGPDAIEDALKNIYCCGSATYKYCCSKPTGYFLEHFNIGAFVGGSIAIVIALIIGIILCCCCCSCCCWKQKQTRRRSMRANGPGQSAVAYSTYPANGVERARGPSLFGRIVPLSHIPVIRHLHGPRTVVSATPVVRETPRAAPPSAVPNSYPKQQYPHQVGVAPSPHQSPHHQPSPHHIPHHATTASPVHHQQPYTAPPIATPAPPGVISAGAAGGYHSPHHIGFAPHVDQPPPYVSTVSPAQMQAPPLLDKGGYHVQGGLGGPSAPPVCNDPPPATNPHYQGNF
ncbi:uncharacterized protein LOC129256358 isoform X1 [Lytechinus pictus]|uniref:uncharacterized protein LOC129256358 isoform X1 n=1 Tax=Lytechinus pictus TaxID=7653 RepID=UPI0030B9E7F7